MRGDTMRRRGHILRMRRGEGSVSRRSPQNDIGYYQPEVLMFAHGKNLLHLNHRASGVKARLYHSASLHELKNSIQTALDLRREANIWEPFELKHILFEGGRRILVRGLGLSDRSPHDDSRIVIVIEELGLQQDGAVLEGQITVRSQEKRHTGDSGISQRGVRSTSV